MNTMNFDNIACVICLFIGFSLGIWLDSSIHSHSEDKYIKTIEEYKRKNTKLIYFIRYKMAHYVHVDEDEGEEYEK